MIERCNEVLNQVMSLVNCLEKQVSSIEYNVGLLKKVVSDGYNGDNSARTSKYKIPEFKSFNGCQDAKEFDNFI